MMLETILIFITLSFIAMSVLYFRCADRCMVEDEEYEIDMWKDRK